MKVQCLKCREVYDLPVTEAEYDAYVESGPLIQRAFPRLTADQRELLLSGMCGICFDKMFRDHD